MWRRTKSWRWKSCDKFELEVLNEFFNIWKFSFNAIADEFVFESRIFLLENWRRRRLGRWDCIFRVREILDFTLTGKTIWFSSRRLSFAERFLFYQWRHELPREASIRLFPLRVHCNSTQFSRTLLICFARKVVWWISTTRLSFVLFRSLSGRGV